jgi:superfamily I DNA/RNA helicase
MKNPFTEAEEQEYYEAMRERAQERERQMREDAQDCMEDDDRDGDKPIKMQVIDDDDTLVYRNELLEQVAQVIDKYQTAFGKDTVASFAALVREMKR